MQSSKFDNDTWYQWKHGAIKKLDGSNYDNWKRSVRSALTVINALRIVTGDEQQPPAGNSTTAKAAVDSYQKRSALAAHLLKHACMPNVEIHVRDLDDPKEIWDTLHRRLDFTASQAGRAAILTRFLNARPEPEEKVGAYIARLQTYQTQLHGTDEAITNGLLKSRIYDTVPSRFKSLVTILRETPNTTIETIIARLSLDEEEHQHKSSGVALYTQGSGRGGRGRGNRGAGNRGGRGRGGRGRGKGNWNRSEGDQGRQGNWNRSDGRQDLSEVVCYQCGKIGHYRRNCPVKQDVNEAVRAVKRRRTESQALVATNQETGIVRANQPAGHIEDGDGLID